MSPKNRLRISVKRQVFSVLTIAYFQGPVYLKPTVYPSTSTLNISQYCMMFGLTYKRCLQFDCRSYISFGVGMLVPPLISIVANPLRHSSVIEERVHSFRRRRAERDLFAVISHVNSTCKVNKGEDVDVSCPQNFFHRVSYVRFCHQDLRR